MDHPDYEFEKLEERLLAFQEDLAPTDEFVTRMRSRLIRHEVLLREGAQVGRSDVCRFWSILGTRAYAVMTAFVFVIFTGGLSTFAYTSDGITHGKLLYPVKRGLERIELALVADSPQANAEFQIKMLRRRLAESRTLVLNGITDTATTSEISLVMNSGIEAIAAVTQEDYRNQLLDQVATLLKNEEQEMYDAAGVALPAAVAAPIAPITPAVPPAAVGSPVLTSAGVASSVATPPTTTTIAPTITASPAAQVTAPVVAPVGVVASPAPDIEKVSSEFIRSIERIRLLKEKMSESGDAGKKKEKDDRKDDREKGKNEKSKEDKKDSGNTKSEDKNDEKKSEKDDDKEQKKDEVKKADVPSPTPMPAVGSFTIPAVPAPVTSGPVIPAPAVVPFATPQVEVITPSVVVPPTPATATPSSPEPAAAPVQQYASPVLPASPPQENVPTSLGVPSDLLKALEKTSQHLKQMEDKVREVKEKEKDNEKEKHDQDEKKGKGGD